VDFEDTVSVVVVKQVQSTGGSQETILGLGEDRLLNLLNKLSLGGTTNGSSR